MSDSTTSTADALSSDVAAPPLPMDAGVASSTSMSSDSSATLSSSAAMAAAIATADAMATAAAANAVAAAAAEAASAAMVSALPASVFASSEDVMAIQQQSAQPPPPAPPSAPTKTKTRSTNLTHEQKRLICLYAKQNPTSTQAQLGKWAKEQFSLASVPSQSSISHTLKRRHTFEHMKTEDWSSKRMRTVKYPDLDTALANWFLYCQGRQIRIQGDEIKAKAQVFFDLMQIQAGTAAEPPQFSNGWLHSFQSRHGFSRSPNSHGVEPELITSREGLVEATKGMAPWDIYWMDETKLSYALNPERLAEGESNMAAALAAQEKQMTIAFCCNTDGSELLDPFFICDSALDVAAEATSSASSAATTQAVEYGFTYAHNKKISMTPTLFREWILSFDWKMHEENRHVMLLLDSFSSHQVKKMVLKNVTVRTVAQSAFGESYLDTVHQTIFSGVKRRYRQLFLTSVLDRGGEVFDVDIMDAIQWVLKSWRELPKALVANAFTLVGIVNDTADSEPHPAESSAASEQAEENLDAQLTVLLKRLKLKSTAPIKLSEFISPANEHIIDEDMSDQDFVDGAMDSGLSTTVTGHNTEPPRKISRGVKGKKPFSSIFAVGVTGRGVMQAARPIPTRTSISADDLSSTTIPDQEWQAWADSQRYRSDDVHALETVIRLASEMNCEATTLLDLTRIQAELLQKRQSDRITPLGAGVGGDGSTTGADGKQTGSVCRFNFGSASTTI